MAPGPDSEFVAFDLETTGLHPAFDAIVEPGIVVILALRLALM